MIPIRLRLRSVLAIGTLATAPLAALAQNPSAAIAHDGAHDFDFEIGTWKTHLRRLVAPLSHSTAWAEYDGTTVVRKVWNGAANLVELEVDGPAGHIGALSLRLYDPTSRRWSLNFANRARGELSTPPAIGSFQDGRGEFTDEEVMDGRTILVRFVISRVGADTCRFEQAYSDDGGRTWEVNWIATDTRIANSDGQPDQERR
jgi:hypothetical protein